MPSLNMGKSYSTKKDSTSAKKRYDRVVLRESKKQLSFLSPPVTNKENFHDFHENEYLQEVAEALLDLSACSPSVFTPVKSTGKFVCYILHTHMYVLQNFSLFSYKHDTGHIDKRICVKLHQPCMSLHNTMSVIS